MGNPLLLDAVEWAATRCGGQMLGRDIERLRELERRSFGFGEVLALRQRALPTWVDAELPSRRAAGYRALLGAVLAAYRAGAVGVWMPYSEWMAAVDCGSSSTLARWVAELEAAQWVRVIATYTPDPRDRRRQIRGASLLVAGPRLLVPAALEGAAGAPRRASALDAGDRRRTARRRAKAAAAGLHEARRRHADPERCGRPLWQGHVGTVDAEPAPAPVAERLQDCRPAASIRFENRSTFPPASQGEHSPAPLRGTGTKKGVATATPAHVGKPTAGGRAAASCPPSRRKPVQAQPATTERPDASPTRAAQPWAVLRALGSRFAEGLEAVREKRETEDRARREAEGRARQEAAQQRQRDRELLADVLAGRRAAEPAAQVPMTVDLSALSDHQRLMLRCGIDPQGYARMFNCTPDLARAVIRAWKLAH